MIRTNTNKILNILLLFCTLATLLPQPSYSFTVSSGRIVNNFLINSSIKINKSSLLSSSSSSSTAEDDEKEENVRLIDLIGAKGNPELQHIRMPFIEPLGNSFIECKMAFAVNVNDVAYIVSTPHDHCVAICYTSSSEIGNKKVRFLQPEDKEMEEIFPIACQELTELCPDLKLKKTPRTLTVSGDLMKYADAAWNSNNYQKPPSTTKQKQNDDSISTTITSDPMTLELLEELSKENTEEDEKLFDETMKNALGDQYISPDNEDFDADDIDPQLLELFNSTTSVSNMDDKELLSIMQEMFLNEDLTPTTPETNTNNKQSTAESLRQEAVAEKLLSFKCDDRTYSLVRMIQPTIVIGRDDPSPQFANSRKLLLSLQEADYILPQLEVLCVEEFKKYGLLPSSSSP